MNKLVWIFIYFVFSAPLYAGVLDNLSNSDMANGLKEALSQSSSAAVSKLAKENGFFGNKQVKIPLPENLRKIEGTMRTFGMEKQADELILSMNRAAEAAVPEAKSLLIASVKNMSVQDAKAILTGDNNAATAYFRKNAEPQLAEKFLPIVQQSTAKVGLAKTYNKLVGKAAKFGLTGGKQASIEEYVTAKTLDGLFFMMAQEEQAIRANPLGRAGDYVGKVFGALKK